MITKTINFNITNVSKSYGSKLVLDNISLSAEVSEAIGILGVNGSGKSTLLSIIAKEYSKKNDISIGYVPQENPLFEELKPIDNIKLWTKKNRTEIIEELNGPLLAPLGVANFLDTPVKSMSGGMKKRLSIASVLINKPDILLMDEPFSALDLVAKKDILGFMHSFRANGGIIIVASHDEDIFNICNKVYLLKNGKLTDATTIKNQGINYIDLLRN